MGNKWHMEKWEVIEHCHNEGGAGTCAVERYTKIPTVPWGGQPESSPFSSDMSRETGPWNGRWSPSSINILEWCDRLSIHWV